MSLLAVLLHLLIFVASGFGVHRDVTVDSGEDVTLQCRAPRDEEITLLEWNKPELATGEYVLFFRNNREYEKYQHDSFKGRVRLRDPSMKNGDVSVILRNTAVSDTGTYECLITTSSTETGERVINEVKHTVNLTVEDSGYIPPPPVDYGYRNGGHKDGSLSLTAALLVPCVLLLLI